MKKQLYIAMSLGVVITLSACSNTESNDSNISTEAQSSSVENVTSSSEKEEKTVI